MPTPINSQRPLAELLTELEAAIRAGDHARATELERTILQRLATEAADRAAVERRVRALMAELGQPPAAPPVRSPAPYSPERGIRSPDADGVIYPVWFGTNRKPTSMGDGFTGERHDRITRGRVEVRVPESHRFGETGTAFWKRLLRFDLRDDRLRVQRVERQEGDAFFSEIHQAMEAARESGEQPHALFFLHGYNVTFEDAAIRAAQIGVDLKVPGAMAFFSWPSRGSVAAYPVDEASIEASERAITDFLVDFTANCGAEKLHDAPRAGYYTPYTVAPGVDTVAVPDFDIDLLGHSYFAQAEALLHDIHDLMRHNEAPAKRQRITAAVFEGTAFWRLRR